MLQRKNYMTSFFPRPHLSTHRQEKGAAFFSVTKLLSIVSVVTDQYGICFILKVLCHMTHFGITIILPSFYATSRKVTGSNPVEVIQILKRPNPSSRIMALGSTQPLTEKSTRNLLGSKGRPARKTGSRTAICEPIF
jgi:hypothetical protein